MISRVLAAVLVARARREERGMALAHPGYADYRARTRAIIPFVLQNLPEIA
jgi:protein-S-isoprenylcysteine O-methyltransferase Ste14